MNTVDTPNVQSLARGLSVITSFHAERPKQTLTQVAESTGLARATARRSLYTLVSLGYADTDGTEFWLTPQVLELGYSYLSSQGLPEIAQPHLEALSRQLRESSSLSILDRTEVIYINRIPVRRIMAVTITVGTRFPAHGTSMGRVLLAGLAPDNLDDFFRSAELSRLTTKTIDDEASLRRELAKVAAQGWCIVDQELELGLRSVAAPVHDAAGDVVAAVNVSTQTAAYSLTQLKREVVPAVRETALQISSDYRATEHY